MCYKNETHTVSWQIVYCDRLLGVPTIFGLIVCIYRIYKLQTHGKVHMRIGPDVSDVSIIHAIQLLMLCAVGYFISRIWGSFGIFADYCLDLVKLSLIFITFGRLIILRVKCNVIAKYAKNDNSYLKLLSIAVVTWFIVFLIIFLFGHGKMINVYDNSCDIVLHSHCIDTWSITIFSALLFLNFVLLIMSYLQ